LLGAELAPVGDVLTLQAGVGAESPALSALVVAAD